MFTWDDYQSGFVLKSSRVFKLKSDPVQNGNVPFADLFNHSYDPDLYNEYDPHRDVFTFKARRFISKG